MRARLALLDRRIDQAARDFSAGLGWFFYSAAPRALYWLWNGINAIPGVRRVGHGLATVLGLYRLDRWWIEHERRADLKLAAHLDDAGLHEQATMLRESAVPPRPQDGP